MARFWNFVQNQGSDDVELRIEGEIVSDDDAWIYEWFGIPCITPNAFRAELAQYAGRNITVWIDSWGGDVFAASGMYNALKEHDGRVGVKIDGKAVSAASIIAMAGEEVLMSPVSVIMIHNPWTFAEGEAREFRHAADVLDQVKEAIVNAYQIKTGRSRSKISQLMDEETWMSPKKAIAEGFADGILYVKEESAEETEPAGAGVQNAFMFSRLAIQNSVAASMRRLIEQCQRLAAQGGQGGSGDDPPAQEADRQAAVTGQPLMGNSSINEQTSADLLDLYKLRVQVNKNKSRR